MRVRQVALVARDLAPARHQLMALLGLDADFADPDVGIFGLENSVMAIGDTFLEVVSPAQANTTAERLLDRRQGDGGYMVITQVGHLQAVSDRVDRLGVRKVWEIDLPGEARAFHLHPKDVPGAICSFDEMTPPESWKWGGPGWENRRAGYATGIVGVEMQSDEPEPMAARWAGVFDLPLERRGDSLVMPLARGEIRFVVATDGRGDGLGGIDLVTPDWARVAAAADSLGLPRQERTVRACGTRLSFIEGRHE